MKRFVFTALVVVVALGVGLWLGHDATQPSAYDVARTSMSLEVARTMLPFKIIFRVAIGGILLATLGGLGWGMVRLLHRRADTVYPDRAGLYPIREQRVAGAKVFHDPNRALTGSTVYATGHSDVAVDQAMSPGQEMAQQQVTGQAQAAQALRAAVSGPMPLPAGKSAPLDLLDGQRVSRPLPDVRTLPWESSHIERLLLQDGEAEE